LIKTLVITQQPFQSSVNGDICCYKYCWRQSKTAGCYTYVCE